MSDHLLQLENIIVDRKTEPEGMFGLWGRKPIRALNGVSLHIGKGETLGIVGGSGAGKSTLLRVATLRLPANRGRIVINGHDMTRVGGGGRRKAMRRMPLIAQDPREDLNVDRPIGKQLVDHLKQAGLADAEQRVNESLARVGLAGLGDRTIRQLSGGQIQRAIIAAALAANPTVIACDEPFSSVDLRLQEELTDLLIQAQREKGIAILLVSHNPRLIQKMAHRVAVFHRGQLFEVGTPDDVLGDPKHPYSATFLRRSSGTMPAEEDPTVTVNGCPWFTHCKISTSRCRTQTPALREIAPGRFAACHEL